MSDVQWKDCHVLGSHFEPTYTLLGSSEGEDHDVIGLRSVRS